MANPTVARAREQVLGVLSEAVAARAADYVRCVEAQVKSLNDLVARVRDQNGYNAGALVSYYAKARERSEAARLAACTADGALADELERYLVDAGVVRSGRDDD